MKMRPLLSDRRVVFILAIAASFFFLVANSAQFFENFLLEDFVSFDTKSYFDAAQLLYGKGIAHPTRPLLFSAIVGLPLLFNCSLSVCSYWMLCLNIVLWFCNLLILYWILRDIVGVKKAFIGSLIYIVGIGNISFTFQVLTETIYTFNLSIIAFCLYRYVFKKEPVFLAYSFLFLCTSVLIRPTFVYFLPIAFLSVIIIAYRNWQGMKSRILFCGIIAISIVAIFTQSICMKKAYGKYTISYIDKLAWYVYLGARSEAFAVELPVKPIKESRSVKMNNIASHVEMSSVSSHDFVEQLGTHPISILRAYLFNLVENSIRGNSVVNSSSDVKNVWFYKGCIALLSCLSIVQNIVYCLMAIFLAGLFSVKVFTKKIRNEVDFYCLLLIVMISYIYFTSGISFWQGDRFNIVFMPLLVIVAMVVWQARKTILASSKT